MPQKYLRQQMENRRLAEHEARRDTRRAWLRACGEVVFWTFAGLFCIGLAFHTFDIQLGRVWWWTGLIVWAMGVTVAVTSAYRRGQNRGDW
jgi:hypothetical protein